MYSIFGKSDVRIVSMIFTVSIFFLRFDVFFTVGQELGSLMAVIQQVAEQRKDWGVLKNCVRAFRVLPHMHHMHVQYNSLYVTLLDKFTQDRLCFNTKDGVISQVICSCSWPTLL